MSLPASYTSIAQLTFEQGEIVRVNEVVSLGARYCPFWAVLLRPCDRSDWLCTGQLHWAIVDLSPDAAYSGCAVNEAQIERVSDDEIPDEIWRRFGELALSGGLTK